MEKIYKVIIGALTGFSAFLLLVILLRFWSWNPVVLGRYSICNYSGTLMDVFSPKSHVLRHVEPVFRQKTAPFAEFGSEHRPFWPRISVLPT